MIDENKCVLNEVANVDGNGTLVDGKSNCGKKNIRQIKQNEKPVLVPKQLVGSDEEELEAGEQEFQQTKTKSVVKVVTSKTKTKKEKVEPETQKTDIVTSLLKLNVVSLSYRNKSPDQSHSERFDPQKYDTKRIKHPPVVKKELSEGAEIYCGRSKCNEVSNDVLELTAHEKQCFVGRLYQCPEPGCTHCNSQKSLLHQHIKAIHYNNPFICDTCKETFVYKKSLDKHLERVYKLGPQTYKYVCPKCGKGTEDIHLYGIHLDRHGNLKRYKCNVSGQAFYSQSQLTTHFKHSCVFTASTSSAFECSVCGQPEQN